MKRNAVMMLVLAGFLSSPLFAQAPAATPAAAPSIADAIRQSYNVVKNNLLKAADKMPDDGYAYQPTPEERTFGG